MPTGWQRPGAGAPQSTMKPADGERACAKLVAFCLGRLGRGFHRLLEQEGAVMVNDIIEAPSQAEIDTYHRQHLFTLPTAGDKIISPLTGARYWIGEQFDQGSFGDVFACCDEW